MGTPENTNLAATAPARPTYQDDDLLRLREAADVLGLSYWTVSRWAARGEFCSSAVRLPGGQWRVRYGDLMGWVRSLPNL